MDRRNTMNFFFESKARLKMVQGLDFKPDPAAAAASTNKMDVWILSSLQTLNARVQTEMKAYFLYKASPSLHWDFLSAFEIRSR